MVTQGISVACIPIKSPTGEIWLFSSTSFWVEKHKVKHQAQLDKTQNPDFSKYLIQRAWFEGPSLELISRPLSQPSPFILPFMWEASTLWTISASWCLPRAHYIKITVQTTI